jgi:type II secretory pathway component PulJ
MKPLKSTFGFTLVETLISMASVGAILLITFAVLQQSTASWRRVSGSQGSSSQVFKAENRLQRDLSLTAYEHVRRVDSLSSLSGKDGDAIWFLSAIDPSSGEFIRNNDGSPRWQRNILYYMAVPTGLADHGFSGSGVEEGGYEVSYPYKVLIRKVIDNAPVSDPNDPNSVETLLTDVSAHLEAPVGYNLDTSGADQVMIVAHSLLGFRVQTDDLLRRVRIELQAANHDEARRDFALGSQSLLNPKYLFERRVEIFPHNRQITIPAP